MQKKYPNRPKKLNSFFFQHHREATIAFSALLILLVRFLFPAKLAGEMFWINLFLFLVFPWLIVRFLLKENLNDFGISAGNLKRGVSLSVIFVLVFVFLNYFLVSKTGFRNQLQIYTPSLASFWIFLWFQLVVSLPSHFSWEFFFRGFLHMGLEKKIGKYAVLFQALAQTLLYARSSWAVIFLIGSSALAAGLVARQSRSIYYSFVSMWIISVCLDIMVIRYLRLGLP
jgi:membrane protease YdiL (CAAX protease family)